MSTYYITTPIYYVNDRPHLGHAYSTIAADVQARFRRLSGQDVRFLTGTDEHGIKVERAAAKAGKSPQALVDENAQAFAALFKKLGISNDDFIRTTQERHLAGARRLWERMLANGHIYKKAYEGFYCSGCESFFPEKDLKLGKCPELGHPVEKSREENYFFRLSAFEKPLLEMYEKQPEFVRPGFRFNEVKAFVKGGLEDLSISRPSVKWGIPVPGDEAQTMYVWIDALSNYLSALDFGAGGEEAELYRTWWTGETCHLLGKDISRFHAVFWPAFLMAAKLPLPQGEIVHGWILKDQQKMSKSLGNTVDAGALADEFGADALRFFLMREVPLGQDGTYSDEILIERINSDLANDLGNTLSRLLQMLGQYRDGKVPGSSADSPLATLCREAHPRHLAAMRAFAYKEAIDAAWKVVPAVGNLLQTTEPWKLARDPAQAAQLDAILADSLNAIAWLGALLTPFMPEKCADLFAQLGLPAGFSLHNRDFNWPPIPPATQTRRGPALFPRIDKADYLARLKKESPMTDPKTVLPPTAAQTDITQPLPAPAAAQTDVTQALPVAGIHAQAQALLHPDKGIPAGVVPVEEIRIGIDDFLKVRLRTAVIIQAEAVEKSDKLVKLQVDLGDCKKQIVAGIRKAYSPESLVGRRIIVVANLKPAKLMGIASEGMLLAATNAAGDVVLLTTDPDKAAEPGCSIK